MTLPQRLVWEAAPPGGAIHVIAVISPSLPPLLLLFLFTCRPISIGASLLPFLIPPLARPRLSVVNLEKERKPFGVEVEPWKQVKCATKREEKTSLRRRPSSFGENLFVWK